MWRLIVSTIPVLITSVITGVFARLLKLLGFVVALLTVMASSLYFFWLYLFSV